jgi:sulfite reductase alpha subunit-like flavoprotein
VVELLDRFRHSKLTLFDLLALSKPLRPRYYSTSSSPNVHGNKIVHATIGRLVVPLHGGDASGGAAAGSEAQTRNFYGLCSNYVHRLRVGESAQIFLDTAEGFHMQSDVTKPMILVSAGTGYAPMRAFLFERQALLQERAQMKQMKQSEAKRDGGDSADAAADAEPPALGPCVLFNGIRNTAHDNIYADELASFQRIGALNQLFLARSRESATREYVQTLIVREAPIVWPLLQQGAYVYICGSAAMRDSVRSAFRTVAATAGGMTADAAEAFIKDLESPEVARYRPDVWG